MIFRRVLVWGATSFILTLCLVAVGIGLGRAWDTAYVYYIGINANVPYAVDVVRGLSRPTSRPMLTNDLRFSPDGSQVVYADRTETGRFELYVAPMVGKVVNLRRARTISRVNGNTSQARWSPDGTQIAFLSDIDGVLQLHVADADGENMRQLTFESRYVDGPAWSPDGQQIAFSHNPTGFSSNIYVINLDDLDIHQITDDTGFDLEPAWSPDGCCIAFNSARQGRTDIYMRDLESNEDVNLTHSADTLILTREPMWINPHEILFLGATNERESLYVVNTSGRVFQLTQSDYLRIATVIDYPYADLWQRR